MCTCVHMCARVHVCVDSHAWYIGHLGECACF